MNFTRPVRGWIIFAQIFGTVMSIIGLVAVAATYDMILNSLDLGLNAEAHVIINLVIALLCYVIVKQFINMVVIIDACKKMDDFTLSANRWIISSLSLTVGGFFTPFIMTRFPNVNVKSTINPKVFLSKVYGYTLLIGGAVFMIVFGAMSGSKLTANTVTTDLTIAFFVINGFFVLLGSILLGLFATQNSNEAIDDSTVKAGFMKFFAGLVSVIVTVELVVMLVYNWIEIIGSVSEAFNSKNENGSVNPFMVMLAMVNLVIGLIYLGFLTQMTCATIKGIWNGEPEYQVFQPLQDRQNKTSNQAF